MRPGKAVEKGLRANIAPVSASKPVMMWRAVALRDGPSTHSA